MTEWEGRVAALRARLEDPALYATAEGASQAQELGGELEMARAGLDSAFAQWESGRRLRWKRAGHR